MASLKPDDRERLIKLLGMLGSEHIGERAVAAKKIEELRTELALEWSDLIITGGETQDTRQHGPSAAGSGVDTALPLDLIDAYSARLSNWEKEFLIDLDKKRCDGMTWTPKQCAKLLEIAASMAEPSKKKYQAFGGGWR